MLLSLTLCGCKSDKERQTNEDKNSKTTIETDNNKDKDENKDMKTDKEEINREESEIPEEGKREETVTTEEPKEDTSLKDEEAKKAEEMEDTKIQGLIERYRDDYEAMSDTEYSSIFGWVDHYHGYFANEEGTVRVSVTNYSDYYGSFSFGIGAVEAFGYKLHGEWEVCGKNKAKLVGLTDWESRTDEYFNSALELQFNEIIVDFGSYEEDMSITVKINDNLEYKCNKIINYFEA